MADRVSQYTIDLAIGNGDRVRQTVDGIERSLRGISDAAKSGDLAQGLNGAAKAAFELENHMQAVANVGDGAVEAFEAYDRASKRAISDLEKQATAINYALSENGKRQRERIEALEKEKAALADTKEAQARKKEIEAELKTLQKDVLRGTDEELRAALANNKAIRARLKLTQENTKIVKATEKQEKTLGRLVKDDLKALRDKIKLQFQFIAALKTTEGRYNAIKKAAGKIGRGAASIAKGAAIGIGGAALALGGAAIAGAQSMVERERESQRVRVPGLSDEDKLRLVGDLYVQTGANYASIVDAINRVYGVIGNVSRDELTQAAAAEIRFPGAASLFRQQTTGAATGAEFSDFASRMRALQGTTGATVEQITAGAGTIANLRQESFKGATQADLLAMYLALQSSGAFDTQEEIETAFRRFVEARKSGEDVFAFAKAYDWTKTAQGATNRQQAAQAIASIDWGAVSTAARTRGEISETAAESTTRKLRELEEMKNRILIKVLEALLPVIEGIDSKKLEYFFSKVIEFIADLLPPLVDHLNQFLHDFEGFIIWWREKFGGGDVLESARAVSRTVATISGTEPQFANGGVASMPSLVGERGPEAVIPLDYSRASRAGNILQSVSQTFNLHGNETTALSIASAVKSRGFMRAVGDNEYINRRFGR